MAQVETLTDDGTMSEARGKVFARLAVLQRLRDEARECGRLGMLQSIEMLMQGELQALKAMNESDENR